MPARGIRAGQAALRRDPEHRDRDLHDLPGAPYPALPAPGLVRFFFFQAEDGIRDATVTGVQTCALPISAFGAAGYWWRRLPSRIHHVLTPIGLAVGTLAYLGLALDLRGGGRGGPWLL